MSAWTIYYAANDRKTAKSIQELVDAGFLTQVPVCPEGGEYTLGDDGWTVCSVHGQIDELTGSWRRAESPEIN